MAEPIRVLHVDDEAEFAELAATYLERYDEDIAVETASSAEEGLDRIETERFDCVISDYDMPGTNGIEFLRAVRDDRPDLPFVLYTGKGSEEVASEAIAAGASDYLQKDTGTEQYELLANRVRNTVDRHRADRRAAESARIRRLVSAINAALVRATSREAAERRVCETVVDTDPYALAWIRGPDPDDHTVRAVAGGDGDRAGDDAAIADREPGARALDRREVVVDDDIAAGEAIPWRETALERGYRGAAAIPLEHEETLFGALVVYADRPNAFDPEERELLAELGDNVAHAIHSFDVRDRLHDERDRRQALFENAPSPVVEGDIRRGGDDHRIADVNRAFEETFGMAAEELVGSDIDDVIVPEDDEVHPEFRERVAEGEAIIREVERSTADGRRLFIASVIPRGVRDGRADGWYAWYIDITERRERERAIESLHDVTAALLEATTAESVAEIVVDAVRRILDLPYTGVHLHDPEAGGLVPAAWTDETEAVIGTPPTFSVDEGRAGECYRAGEPRVYEEITESPGPYNPDTPIESEILVPLGDHGMLLVGSPERDAFGEVDLSLARLLAGHATAVLHRIERERVLEQLQSRTRSLMAADDADSIADIAVETASEVLGADLSGVHLTCDDGRRLELATSADSVAEEFDELPGYDRDDEDDLTGEVVWDAFDSGEARIIHDVRDRSRLAEQTPSRSVIIHPLGDHGVFIVSSIEPNAFDETDAAFVEIVAASVTAALDRVAREEELRERNERLDEFASLVSHDLRNPLDIVQGRITLAREETENDHLDHAERALDRAMSLLEESLSFARSGHTEAALERVDLATAAAESWTNVATGEATLSVEVDRTVRADPNKLKQLFENLFGNAVRHGGDAVRVAVEGLADGFAVVDDGPGFAEADRDLVFDAGYTTADDGTGFGMYIVGQIAEAHGWRVAVADADDGARIEVTGDGLAGVPGGGAGQGRSKRSDERRSSENEQ
ncbi:GAF domain-containing protein (plasmid) [Halobaculum sp. CBA1158]|uniref:GAF domain-containing protein n=1 Tax=Halobaculum sp. CBA1158 TaxID=2904243 RepID=UPI001F2D186F|nr:GAF domain-containing protein [Halobaculum sp. CBA1158]UIP01381.1 GAF domain-containing protein [Halobaculum sp. CBA1158]